MTEREKPRLRRGRRVQQIDPSEKFVPNPDTLAQKINIAVGCSLPGETLIYILAESPNYWFARDSYGQVRIERFRFNKITESFYYRWNEAMSSLDIAEQRQITEPIKKLVFDTSEAIRQGIFHPYPRDFTVGALRGTPVDELISKGRLSIDETNLLLGIFRQS